ATWTTSRTRRATPTRRSRSPTRWASADTTPAFCLAVWTELAFAAAPTTMRAGRRRGGDFVRSKVGAWRGRDDVAAAAPTAGRGFQQLAVHRRNGRRCSGGSRPDERSGRQ